MPYWIEADVNKYLPKIFEFLEKKFDLALNFKPVIYLNYEKTTKKRLRNKGGTLPGLIQLTFKGSDWKIKNKESIEWLFWFLAHEATHLWNGQLLRYSASKHAWMHEGSADAFASRVLRHFGLIDDNTFSEYIKKSKIKCINGLEDGIALMESSKLRKFGNYYDCGHLIAQMTEKSLQKGDLFDFYRTLFHQELAKDRIYSGEEYFQLWQTLKKKPFDLGEIKVLIYKNSNKAEKVFNNKNLGIN